MNCAQALDMQSKKKGIDSTAATWLMSLTITKDNECQYINRVSQTMCAPVEGLLSLFFRF